MTKEQASDIVDELYEAAVARYLDRTDWDYSDYMTEEEEQRYIEAYKIAYGYHPYGEDYENYMEEVE